VKDFVPDPSGRSPAVSEPLRERNAVSADDLPGELDRKSDQLRASEVGAGGEALGLVSPEGAVRRGAGSPAAVAAQAVGDQDVALDEERRGLGTPNAGLPERFDPAMRSEAAPVDRPPSPSSEAVADALSNEKLEVARTVRDTRKTLERERPEERATAVDGVPLITGERGSAGVPGLEIERIDAVELPAIGRARLIVNVLPNGGDLELWSLSTSALAAASPRTDPANRAAEITAYFRSSLPPRWSMTVRQHPGGFLVARAPLPQGELDALMARVLDGG